ncbi:phosphotransferase family protein [Kribbella speibonae]|uniref:phosphotransferase family protein n=1 Tax=Kribbella speibonae TaxID=1572660 RepID=UPI001EDE7AA3|nr:phosphotransferase family protein [Kribbella speibonae]
MSVPGLDIERLGSWLPSAVPGAGSELTATLIAGGNSNLTYEVTDGAGIWIVRRPPLGHVLATAHDMAREYRVISALRPTGVPVPRAFALCEDADVLGAPFYVMEKVTGRPYRYVADIASLGPERTRAISESLVDVLVRLHDVDPAAVGLADFGRSDGFLKRQVRRWKKQLDASYTQELAAAEELHARLAADIPTESATGIVHGDYRLDNALVDESDRLVAVIDWEMATLGDPLTDLALMVVYGRLADALPGRVADVTSAPGYLSERQVVGRYAAASPRDMSRFGFYLGLASFKLAVILQGIHYRYVQGHAVGADVSHLGEAIEPLLEGGLTAIKEDS